MNVSSGSGKRVLLDNHAKARNLHWPQQPWSAARILKCFFQQQRGLNSDLVLVKFTLGRRHHVHVNRLLDAWDRLSPPEDPPHVRGRCSRERNAVSTCEVNISMWMAPTSLVK